MMNLLIKMGKQIAKHKFLILLIGFLLLIPSLIGTVTTKVNYDLLSYLPDTLETVKGQDILVDEYGGVSGMVTLEDLIEEIVGDIHEKYEEEEPEIQELEPHRVYRIAGSISLFDLKEKLHLHMDSTCDTLSGYLMELLGHIPEEGELPLTAQTEEAYFEIESVEDRVIDKVKLTLRDLPDAIEEEEILQKISRQM